MSRQEIVNKFLMPIIDKYEHINNLNAVVDFHEFKKKLNKDY